MAFSDEIKVHPNPQGGRVGGLEMSGKRNQLYYKHNNTSPLEINFDPLLHINVFLLKKKKSLEKSGVMGEELSFLSSTSLAFPKLARQMQVFKWNKRERFTNFELNLSSSVKTL